MTAPRRGLGFGLALALLALLHGPAAGEANLGAGHDTSLPIEITADSLEVQQESRIAVFSGNVDAVQGSLSLRADRLTVHYATGVGDGPSAISLIEAEGNVFLSSPSETARGARGLYDVAADRVELVGDVVLTRGENVIRGDRLELDLATGRSEIKSGQGRVKALFVPPAEGTQ